MSSGLIVPIIIYESSCYVGRQKDQRHFVNESDEWTYASIGVEVKRPPQT